MPNIQYFINKAPDGQFYFILFHKGEGILVQSELYPTKQTCLNGVAAVQSNSPYGERIVKKKDRHGKHYFIVRSGNHKEVARSYVYEDYSAMEKDIALVVQHAKRNDIIDKT